MSRLLLGIFSIALAGCATTPVNPAFPASSAEAHNAVESMRDRPVALQRPLVIVGGFLDPDISPTMLKGFFAGITTDAHIIPVSVCFCTNFDECRAAAIDAVDRDCPNHDPQWTSEVDVVGVSLGGLVARYSAAESLDPAYPRRLKIARLFTISSPNAGAVLAPLAPQPDFNCDLREHSFFMRYLANQDKQAHYQLIPYVHLGDEVVGAQFAAPPGQNPYWLPNDSLLPPHAASAVDERILADISRRLRNEKPLTIADATPLP